MTAKFPQRKIGDDLVSAIGLGCLGMSVPPDGANDEESLRVLTAAADMGINFWDTSDMYGPYLNEKLIGRWFKETGRRDEIFLATKFGIKFVDGKPQMDSTPEHVKAACAGSLERLGTDRIDLYYQHRVDPNVPIERTVEAMAQLKKESKIRYLGLSECSARTLQRACKIEQIAAAQMEFSPFALEIESEETDFLKAARELGVKIVPYSPLGRGILTGAIKTRDDLDEMRRNMHPRFSEENFPKNIVLVHKIQEIATQKGCPVGQLALAWVLAQGDDFIPIPGTKRLKYLEQNAGAVKVELTKQEEEGIRKAVDEVGGRQGERYPEAFKFQLFGDTPEL
ncbi:aldo-keto reductase [Polyplosphaeria fusca]|uniref:Aldo-keto reductase n=1 Tax=Polyplosphaeria fusca TaxID=682080 RepID=A0A9P4QWG7_9PLEO|nr:aldo-keto reductase [Polyplosphaeria fusca]